MLKRTNITIQTYSKFLEAVNYKGGKLSLNDIDNPMDKFMFNTSNRFKKRLTHYTVISTLIEGGVLEPTKYTEDGKKIKKDPSAKSALNAIKTCGFNINDTQVTAQSLYDYIIEHTDFEFGQYDCIIGMESSMPLVNLLCDAFKIGNPNAKVYMINKLTYTNMDAVINKGALNKAQAELKGKTLSMIDKYKDKNDADIRPIKTVYSDFVSGFFDQYPVLRGSEYDVKIDDEKNSCTVTILTDEKIDQIKYKNLLNNSNLINGGFNQTEDQIVFTIISGHQIKRMTRSVLNAKYDLTAQTFVDLITDILKKGTKTLLIDDAIQSGVDFNAVLKAIEAISANIKSEVKPLSKFSREVKTTAVNPFEIITPYALCQMGSESAENMPMPDDEDLEIIELILQELSNQFPNNPNYLKVSRWDALGDKNDVYSSMLTSLYKDFKYYIKQPKNEARIEQLFTYIGDAEYSLDDYYMANGEEKELDLIVRYLIGYLIDEKLMSDPDKKDLFMVRLDARLDLYNKMSISNIIISKIKDRLKKVSSDRLFSVRVVNNGIVEIKMLDYEIIIQQIRSGKKFYIVYKKENLTTDPFYMPYELKEVIALRRDAGEATVLSIKEGDQYIPIVSKLEHMDIAKIDDINKTEE